MNGDRPITDLSVTTTSGQRFTDGETRTFARLLFKRFGYELGAAAAAWGRMLGNSTDAASFRRLLVSGAINVGDRVRTYDFPNNGVDGGLFFRSDCYMRGVVLGFEFVEGCMRYRIGIDSRVFAGKTAASSGVEIVPPVNGSPTLMGNTTDGVVHEDELEIETYIALAPNKRY